MPVRAFFRQLRSRVGTAKGTGWAPGPLVAGMPIVFAIVAILLGAWVAFRDSGGRHRKPVWQRASGMAVMLGGLVGFVFELI